jgi:hypothetical protein
MPEEELHERLEKLLDRLHELEDEVEETLAAHSPISPKCAAVIERGPTKEICEDFREQRRLILCLAWKKIEEKKIPFREARREAQAEVTKACLLGKGK